MIAATAFRRCAAPALGTAPATTEALRLGGIFGSEKKAEFLFEQAGVHLHAQRAVAGAVSSGRNVFLPSVSRFAFNATMEAH